MVFKTVYSEVEVDVNLGDFDTEDLIEELDNRGHMANSSSKEILEKIYLLRRNGKDYQKELDELIFITLGKFI